MLSNFILPTPINKKKAVRNTKLAVVASTSTISIESKDSKNSITKQNVKYIRRVKSQKSVTNSLSYKVGMKSNTAIPQQARPLNRSVLLKSVPSKILQSNTQRKIFIPFYFGSMKSDKLTKSKNLQSDKDVTQKYVNEETNVIPMLLTKIQSMEEQISDIESKTKKLNDAVSKQNDLKMSSAVHDLNTKHSSLRIVTNKAVSHKIYSKNTHSPRKLKKSLQKKSLKKGKYHVSSSSDQSSKVGDFKNIGLPLENFKDCLKKTSIGLVDTKINAECPVNDISNNYLEYHSNVTIPSRPTIINGKPLGDPNSMIRYDVLYKLFSAFSEVNNSTTDQQQETEKHVRESTQNEQGDFHLGCRPMSKPTFDWKHKSLFSTSDSQVGEINRKLKESSNIEVRKNKSIPATNNSLNRPIQFSKIEKPVENFWSQQKSSVFSYPAPSQSVDIKSANKEEEQNLVIQENASRNNRPIKVKSVIGMYTGLDKSKIPEIIVGPYNKTSVMSNDLAEFVSSMISSRTISGKKTVLQSSVDLNELNAKKSSKEMCKEQTILKSDCGLDEPDSKDSHETYLTSPSSQYSRGTADNSNLFNSISADSANNCCNNIFVSNDTLLKSVQSCHNISEAATASNNVCHVSSKDSKTKMYINGQENNLKQTVKSFSEETKEPKIKITILVEDSLKRAVELKSNFISKVIESKCTEDVGNIHLSTLCNIEDNGDKFKIAKSDQLKRSNVCYSLDNLNNEPTIIRASEQIKNQRNDTENKIFGVRNNNCSPTLSAHEQTTFIVENPLEFGGQGRYLNEKARKVYNEFANNKCNISPDFVFNPQTKSQTNINNYVLAKENLSKYSNNHELSGRKTKFDCDNTHDTSKSTEKVNNFGEKPQFNVKLPILEDTVGEAVKHTLVKSTLLLNDDEIQNLDHTKSPIIVDDNQSEAKQPFFRVIDQQVDDRNSLNKHMVVDSKRRSCRYGLTLYQEPILEESEDELSCQGINYNEHQSEKGDNIEIKAVECECSNTSEATEGKKDVSVLPVPEWFGGTDTSNENSTVKSPVSSSVSVQVQTDWSLTGNTVNGTGPKQSVSSQTDIIMEQMALFDKEIIDSPDYCKCHISGSQFSELVPCKPINLVEKGSSRYIAKQQRSLAIKMKKEKITEVKLSDLLISVVRDGENSVTEIISTNDAIPENVITVRFNNKESVTPTETLLCDDQTDQKNSINQQNEQLYSGKVDTTIETIHRCTARCYNSQSDESDLSSVSESDAVSSKLLQDINSAFPESQLHSDVMNFGRSNNEVFPSNCVPKISTTVDITDTLSDTLCEGTSESSLDRRQLVDTDSCDFQLKSTTLKENKIHPENLSNMLYPQSSISTSNDEGEISPKESEEISGANNAISENPDKVNNRYMRKKLDVNFLEDIMESKQRAVPHRRLAIARPLNSAKRNNVKTSVAYFHKMDVRKDFSVNYGFDECEGFNKKGNSMFSVCPAAKEPNS